MTRAKSAMAAAALALLAVLALMIPPAQSPDENAHLVRAYLLTRGQLMLDTRPGLDSGGAIDAGLSDYLVRFNYLGQGRDTKVTKEVLRDSFKIRWKHETAYWFIPGIGYYFPAVYLPQAAALALAERVDLPVAAGFYLARLFAAAAAVGLCAWGFSLYPTNPFVLGLLILPMMLFQFASASLDGVATGLTVLVASLLLRGADRRCSFPWGLSVALAVSVGLLVGCRAHLVPLLAAPLLVYGVRRERSQLIAFGVVAILTATWLALASRNIVDTRIAHKQPMLEGVGYYVSHPGVMMRVMVRTVTDAQNLQFYLRSFIGILGWLEINLATGFYAGATLLLLALAGLSVTTQTAAAGRPVRVFLAGSGAAAIFLIFFLLLNQWTPFPADQIQGVQGRYFTMPLILLGYSLSGLPGPGATFGQSARGKAARVVLLVLLLASYFETVRALLTRYY